MTETITDLSAAEKHALLFVAQCTIDGLDDEAPVWDTVGYTLTIGNLRDLLAEHAKQRELLGVAGRQLEAAEAQPCDHNSEAIEALERLHGRLYRDLPNDGSELAPPEDPYWARVLDDLLAFADEVYLPLADATAKAAPSTAAAGAPVTVWWLEGDDDYNEPALYTTPEAAKAAGIAVFRRLNDDDEFPDRAFDWVAEQEFEGGSELLVHDVTTGLTVRPFTVQGEPTPAEPNPLETAVTEALADIAAQGPAEPETAPIRHAWLIEAGDD